MLKMILLVFIIAFPFSSEAKKKHNRNFTREYNYKYPELYRDHVFDTLSEKGKEMFYAVDIQPSCVAKKGQCIPRAWCVGREMLYISRICYKRDLVCCYDNTIRFPEVGNNHHTTTITTTTTEEEKNVTTTEHTTTLRLP